ncbi:MAG: phospholipid carrier-dependent glycosyltransferase, partial [Acidobacteriota bacterium]
SGMYQSAADGLRAHGRFVYSPDRPDLPLTVRTPGYPVFLALTRGAADALGVDPVRATVAAQVVVRLLMLAGLALLARRLGLSPIAAAWATVLAALDPVGTAMAGQVLSESLFAALLVLALVVAVRALDRDASSRAQWTASALAGALLAAAVLTRPIGQFLVPLLLLALLVGGAGPWRLRAARGVAALLPIVLLVGPWTLHMVRTTGAPGLSPIAEINLLRYRAAAVVALRDGVDLETARVGLGIDGSPWMRAAEQPGAGLGARWRREAVPILLAHPDLTLRVHAIGFARVLLSPGDGDLAVLFGLVPDDGRGPLGDLRRRAPADYARVWLLARPVAFGLFLGTIALLAAVYLGVARWLLRRIRAPRPPTDVCHLLVLACALALLVLAAGPEGGARFRVPVLPLLTLFAVAGWSRARGGVDADVRTA